MNHGYSQVYDIASDSKILELFNPLPYFCWYEVKKGFSKTKF